MSVLIIAATEMEIAPFIEKYPHASHLITGVGATMAAYKLSRKIRESKIDYIIQAGIAGSFVDSIELGETVIVHRDAFADLGVDEKRNFSSVAEMGLFRSNEFPFENGFLVNPHLLSLNVTNKNANAITVNMLSDDVYFNSQFQQKFQADIETMEGAALHYVCLEEKIPFLQIRGISNKVGERDKSKWKIAQAVESSNCCLIEIYESIQHQLS